MASSRLRAILELTAGAGVLCAAVLACNSIIGLDGFVILPDAGADGGSDAGDASLDAATDAVPVVPNGSLPVSWASTQMPDDKEAGAKAGFDYQASIDITLDNVTTRTWMTKDFDAPTFEAARDLCAKQDVAGVKWRLPSRIELVSLLDHTRTPPDPRISGVAFPGATGGVYHTGSLVRPLQSPPAFWAVDFDTGNVRVGLAKRVRCVQDK